MQHFGPRGFHARALARREDDDVDVRISAWTGPAEGPMPTSLNYRPDRVLTGGGVDGRGRRRRFQRRAKRVVVAQRLEVGIACARARGSRD